MKAQFITAEKPLWLDAMAVYPYNDLLHSRYWAEDKNSGEPFNLSWRKGEHLLVPRALVHAYIKDDRRTLGTKVRYAVNCSAPPRNEEQARVYAESLALLKQDRSHIVRASTGFGKTWLGVRLAVALGVKVLIIVPKSDLLTSEEQWMGSLQKFAGLKKEQIGIIRQKKCQVEGKHAVIAMVHSLAKEGKYPEWIYDEFGLVIFDEVHRMAADSFQKVCGLFNAKYRLGLSAGTKLDTLRGDGKDFVFEAHIGEVLVESEYIETPPKVLVLETPFKLPMVKRIIDGEWKSVKLPHEHGKLGAVLKAMAECPERNQLIVDLVGKMWQKQRTGVVFSDLARDLHLDNLARMSVQAGVPENQIGFYVGGMKAKDIAEAKTKRIVFATYGMTGEATDVPHWDSCILATPRANVKQPIGRVLRPLPGKPRPLVFDLVDYDSMVCQSYFAARRKLYESSEVRGEVVLVKL